MYGNFFSNLSSIISEKCVVTPDLLFRHSLKLHKNIGVLVGKFLRNLNILRCAVTIGGTILKACRGVVTPVVTPVVQFSLFTNHCTYTLCKKIYIGKTGRRQGDCFCKHLWDIERNDKDASKPILSNISISLIILANIRWLWPFPTPG